MIEYGDEDLLMLSGIQHITFCERQWALIHIEQFWAESKLTIEGEYLHRKVDDPLYKSERSGVITLRSLPLLSRKLGLYGLADAVDFHQVEGPDNAITLPGYQGYWAICPIEYKRGKPKKDEIDKVQLCAQAMCLEEMYSIEIEHGSLFYHEIRRKESVVFDNALRSLVIRKAKRMHEFFDQNKIPLPVFLTHCKSCSLYDECMPEFFSKKHSVKKYLNDTLNTRI